MRIRIAQLLVLFLLMPLAACGDDPPQEHLSRLMVNALKADNEEALRGYLEDGLDPDARHKIDGYTALWYAAGEPGGKCLKLLLEAGADPNLQSRNKMPPILNAILNDHRANVRLLLEHGADPNADVDGRSSVLVTAVATSEPEIVELLLDHGGDPLKPAGIGGSALFVAAGLVSVTDPDCTMLRTILDHLGPEGDIDAPGSFGMTALMGAATTGNVEAGRLLLEAGADPDKKNMGGGTALGNATVIGHLEFSRMLVAQGADVNVRGVGQITPLHFAAREGHHEYLKELVEAGANLNAKDDQGNTPLHLAASGGDEPGPEEEHRHTIRLLLNAGADKTIENSEGQLPVDVACYEGLRGLLTPDDEE